MPHTSSDTVDYETQDTQRQGISWSLAKDNLPGGKCKFTPKGSQHYMAIMYVINKYIDKAISQGKGGLRQDSFEVDVGGQMHELRDDCTWRE